MRARVCVCVLVLVFVLVLVLLFVLQKIHSSTNIPFTKPLSYQRAQRQAIALDVPECLEESLDCDTITPICSPEQVVRGLYLSFTPISSVDAKFSGTITHSSQL